jgi:cell division septal protein FtsQ
MSSYRRTPPRSLTLRARRRRRRRILIALVILIAGAVIGGVVYLLRAPFLRIQTVQVTGADPQSTEEIRHFVEGELSGYYNYFLPKNHVWEYSRADLERRILVAFPRLQSAELKLQSSTALTITVSDRMLRALWCGETPDAPQACLSLDQNGAAFAPAEETSADAYVTYYGALSATTTPPQLLAPAQFHALSALIAALEQAADSGPAVRAAIDADGNVDLTMENGFMLKFTIMDALKRANILVTRLTIARSSAPFQAHKLNEFEYLDLRFGDSLYYKLKGAQEPVTASTTQSIKLSQ